MDNQFVTRTNKPAVFLSILIIFIIPVICAVFLHNYNFLTMVTYISMIILGAIILINVIISLVMPNKLFNARKMRAEIIDKQQEMLADYPRYERRLKLIAVLSVCYLAVLVILIMILNTAVFAFYSRIFIAKPVLNPFIVVGLSILLFSYELPVFVSASKSLIIESQGELLSEAQYPRIFELAKEAAKKAGINNPFNLKVVLGRNASIFKENGDTLTILLGIDLLNILNSDELHAVLLHEFAHAKNDTQISHKISSRCNKWQYWANKTNFFPSFLFRGFSVVINKHFALFRILSSYRCEVAADKNITDEEEKQHAVNAFAKLEVGKIYDFSLPEANDYCNPEMPNQFIELNKTRFIDSYNKNKESWEKIALKQIQPLINSHPSLPDRMKNLNIEFFNIDFSCKDEKYNHDITEISEKINGFMKAETDWELLHQRNYLCYQKIIDSYNLNQAAYKDMYVVAYAYYCLCDYVSAEKILKTIINDKKHSAALFLSGLLKCSRFDDSGIKDLFDSADNSNHAEKAIQFIGSYLQYRGDQALVDAVKAEYNERSADFMDAVMIRTKKIKIKKLPKDDLSKLRPFIRDLKNIDGVLLVRKKSKKRTLNILLYSVLDENYHNLIIDNIQLESFIVKECPNIILGGIMSMRDFMEISNKFKYRVKNEIQINQINKASDKKVVKNFVDDKEGRIAENEVRLWQGMPMRKYYRIIIQIIVIISILSCAGGIIGYISKSINMGFIILPVIFIAMVIIWVRAADETHWIIVTEKKLVYKKRLYFWFNYNEIVDIKIFRRPIDYLLGTKSIVIKNIHTWADMYTRAVVRQAVGNSYVYHVHDAEGMVSAIKQAMVKEKKNAV